MILPLLVLLLVLLGASAVVALTLRSGREALAVGTGGSLAVCLLGVWISGDALLGAVREEWQIPWSVPMGALHVGLDPLSSFFLLCIFLVSGLAALYGGGYLLPLADRRPLGGAIALFHLLVASMVGAVIARDGVLFLFAWEIMTLSSFFLVTFDHEEEEVRRAGFAYLIASHLGTVPLLLLFLGLPHPAPGYDFAGYRGAGGAAGAAFLLALAGFGTKAGFWPVHLWLPDAHPAAPTHVSALMSGVMIKMGIYGLLRTLTFLPPPPPWWGGVLLAVGIVSALAGVLHALAQHDLKRLLAYHSVENIGIIVLGVGLGVLGRALGAPAIAFLGFAGALFHVLNHGLFKGLLFQGAGAVLLSTGTRDLDSLGGLARRMPKTALFFLTGALAISALPPLNGFASEFLLYLASLKGVLLLPPRWGLAAFAVVPSLALVGGLAAACFVKAYGVAFLGEARSPEASGAREPSNLLLVPMAAGGGLCLILGLAPAPAVRALSAVVLQLDGGASLPPEILPPLEAIARLGGAVLLLALLLAFLRRRLLRGRPQLEGATWGCGYAAPTPRMQYTAASFAQPILDPFSPLLPTRIEEVLPSGPFPREARYEAHLGDLAGERILLPLLRRGVALLGRFRPLQEGRVQVYLAYIFLTLLGLLAWIVRAEG